MSDLIDRKKAIDAFWQLNVEIRPLAIGAITDMLNGLPPEHPEDYEWCTGCKEYDHERGCCPRFGNVIAETVEEVKQNLQFVHCEDCENFTPGKDGWGSCFENPMKAWRTTDFCSWGERRTDG